MSVSDWCQISAGIGVIGGIRSNGTAWVFGGQNSNGQLGDNSTVSKSSPVSVVGGFTDWCRISSGSNHILAIKVYPKVRFFVNDGNVYYNDADKSGVQLGDFLQPAPTIPSLMLLESGDILLTETGDVLITE